MRERYIPGALLFWLVASLLPTGCALPYKVSGLRPVYPEVRRRFSVAPDDVAVVFVEVNSPTPAFRWEPFPRPQDREADKEGVLNRISDVTYDLRVWGAEERDNKHFPAELFYSREGLPSPWHRLERLLVPCTKYFWNIRARFKLDGQTRITDWGVVGTSAWRRRLASVSNPFFYRFNSPC
jgi:hypothetical protein